MCVDDEDDILDVMKLCLELNGGLAVSCCRSGYEALQRAPDIRPDLVLLDVMMPGMDGPSTFQKLRETPGCQDLPVIFVTARVRESETQEYLGMGASGVLAKPFDPAAFCTQIEKIWFAVQEQRCAGEVPA